MSAMSSLAEDDFLRLVPHLRLAFADLAPRETDQVARAVAERLGDSPAFVDGVVSFYTMYHTSPPARYVLQVCTTLSCSVCGGRELVEHLKAKLGVGFGEKTPDGSFQLVGVQCLGACGNAPVIQVNDDYYENLTPQRLDAMLDELREGR